MQLAEQPTPLTNEAINTWHGIVPQLLNEHGSRTVAEVGVWRGSLSGKMLHRCPRITRLTLVDSWTPVYGNDPDHGWMVFGPGTDDQEMADAYRTVVEQFKHDPRVLIYKMPSVQGAELVADGSLDAVIIDALHTYHACKEDILAWWPKLRPGGLMIGDDLSPWFPGVQIAVEEVFGAQYRALGQTWWKIKEAV
jgi:hypothetical protein